MNKDMDTNDAVSKVEASDTRKVPKDVVKSGGEYYREGSRVIASTVQEQPLSSLLVAGVIGFMLALILNR